jgi:hypothetical protein
LEKQPVSSIDNKTEYIQQLDAVLDYASELEKRSEHNDWSGLREADLSRLITMATAAVERIAGKSSSYSRQFEQLCQPISKNPGRVAQRSVGIVKALRSDVDAGFIQTVVELAHADVFADFLEMAEHLLGSNYKDAAAVISGSALEAHIRKLCQKAGISTIVPTTENPKKADEMVSDLQKSGSITPIEAKSIRSWLGLRNSAAHGNYTEYLKEEVTLMIAGIQGFMGRKPA